MKGVDAGGASRPRERHAPVHLFPRGRRLRPVAAGESRGRRRRRPRTLQRRRRRGGGGAAEAERLKRVHGSCSGSQLQHGRGMRRGRVTGRSPDFGGKARGRRVGAAAIVSRRVTRHSRARRPPWPRVAAREARWRALARAGRLPRSTRLLARAASRRLRPRAPRPPSASRPACCSRRASARARCSRRPELPAPRLRAGLLLARRAARPRARRGAREAPAAWTCAPPAGASRRSWRGVRPAARSPRGLTVLPFRRAAAPR